MMEVVNTQWLYREPAAVVSETPKTITVRHGRLVSRFWKDSGLMVGWSKVVRRGGEPDRLVGMTPNSAEG